MRRRDPRYPRIAIGVAVAALTIGVGAASARTVSQPEEEAAAAAGETEEGLLDPEGAAGTDETGTATGAEDDAASTGTTEASGQDQGTEADGGTGTDEGAAQRGEPRRDRGARLKLEKASPKQIFYNGLRRAEFRFEIAGTRARDIRIQAVRKGTGRVVRGWMRENVKPGKVQKVRWRGNKRGGGEVRKGRYVFRAMEDGEVLDRKRARGDRKIDLYGNKFPLRARHGYGDGYGAGRGHRGVDIFSRCGKRIVAARAGRVQWKAYQGSGAGHYVVIDGRSTRRDYVYMHLRGRADVRKRERVRTGQTIGRVGASGNAQGCHLHFELWQGDWYGGGKAKRNVKQIARRWDRWS